MRLLCKLGIHKWNGCTCMNCQKNRNSHHNYATDCTKCSICEGKANHRHDWSQDCQHCSKCSKTRNKHHDWSQDCQQCSNCTKTQDVPHDWSKDCQKCSNCLQTRKESHDFSRNCEKCSKCETTRENEHWWHYDCQKCYKCGMIRDREHDWSNDCEKCCCCKVTRPNQHKFENGLCVFCNQLEAFIDERDGKKYKMIKIGEHIWMAENLAHDPKPTPKKYIGQYRPAYTSSRENEDGYEYDWQAAHYACPIGWHLPSNEEWNTLVEILGGEENAAKELRMAKGFNVRPHPPFYYMDGSTSRGGSYYWTSSKVDEREVWIRFFSYQEENIEKMSRSSEYLFYVRCVKD